MATLDDVYAHLAHFHGLIPGLPPLAVSSPWHIPHSWATASFPNASAPGVYLFFDANGNVLYVGKASSGLGKRIGNEYIGQQGISKSAKSRGATVLRTIPLEKHLWFLAPAVEEFLIFVLRPPNNINGVPYV